ncbi:cell surface protein SprA [Pedobacter sp. HMF7647]|uniref:Cell surface protein SprA n=2 Tax=Hufsiella arboris TaxID=2695275 RepID=A0A7K1YAZ6_9SPHI|nr:cell surface protein SprA [Hufsiella arboris]MXV51753.1 cell surface protein SprA [Hufsiella arboris]
MLLWAKSALAQNTPLSAEDSLKLRYPFKDTQQLDLNPKPGFFLPNPSNIQRTVEFDPITKQYIIREKIGDHLYRPPQYLTIGEYQKYESELMKRDYWRQLSDLPVAEAREPGFIPPIIINNKAFEKIFGGSTIDIRPQGSAELTLSGRINKNENPLFNERQRTQANFDFDQRIQMNVVGQIGEKLRLSTNYNTEAQFDFENQIKLDYTGKPDEIIQKIEAGNVSLPLSSTLITGSQSLFGLKTQLKFGRMNVTSIFSQQKSQSKEIVITNGSQQNEFRLLADNYETNKHYFLSQYFRNNYNKALANIPVITSNINITKIEVWITNRSSSTVDSRDILAFLDLGENRPYNTTLVQGGPGFTGYPAGFQGPGFPQQSNNLLQNLPADARFTNSNSINAYFQPYGATDNYAKLTYARKLTEREFVLNPKLGYISLNAALNADEVLAVAYRYTVNGQEFQVGEFSTDITVDPSNPKVMFVKLLKNETLKTNLPTWDLMMKNIYSLGAYQVSRNNFNLSITRLDENTGVERPAITEGANTTGKLWLQLANLDNLNQQQDRQPDGYFDFLDGITIDAQNGRITFPLLEPFGSDLAAKFNPAEQALIDKYTYQALYDSTKIIAQQLFQNKNRYIIKGTYQSEVSSEFQLNAINVPPGSVQVFAGTLPLQEGADFTVDYNIGRVRILNQALLNSGQQIRIKLENSELFGLQQRSLFGTRLDYHLSNKLNLGGTIMNLTEKPLTQKINIGEEPISNTIWGMDVNYSSPSRWLTRMIDKLPFLDTKEPSSVTFNGEFANLIPGHPRALNFAGTTGGISYLDDFEASRSIIDIKSPINWQISGTPQMFPESQLSNDLAYGYNRARLAFYTIDPLFYNRSSSLNPDNIKNNRNEQSNHYVREILEQEVFPFKQSATGQPLTLPTLDLAFYPMVRGPYNFTTTGVNQDGTLNNPRNRWGGIFKKLESTDFESLNIEFVEMWMMDPFIYKPNSAGGDLYFNLGSTSEDILKDGRKSLENGLSPDGSTDGTDLTNWGRVPKLQPVIQAFDNNPSARQFQDIGLDGLGDSEEQQIYATFLSQVRGQLSPQAADELGGDPSSDDYQYYRGGALDDINAGILKRYERYNGTEGNSKTTEQSLQATGIENTAATALPDGEDINRDNNSSLTDEYFQYKMTLKPNMNVGDMNGFITDKVISDVKLANGTTQRVTWYQIRVPINQYDQKVGNIQDFKSIRFIRMFMTNFADTAILRMGRLQLVRGDWRTYNSERSPAKVIADPALGNSPGLDNSTLDVGTVNIEENGRRSPIPYVVPPGIERERDYSNYRGDTRQNEQSLSLNVNALRDGYGRATFRTTYNDFRSYKRIQMFIHAEGGQLRDNDVSAFIRIGADNQDNYYEYDIPMKVTLPGTSDPNAIWPDANKLDVELSKFQAAKTARNNATLNGVPWPINEPYKYTDGANTIIIKGQPDLSKARVYMLGVMNPLKGGSGSDDGLDKSAILWFNELRLTDFDERGGWAATARLNARLADFADVTVSGSLNTIGFGSIDKRVSERYRSDDHFFDVSSGLELGKFFPNRAGIKIPVFINLSSQIGTPQYDPRTPDIELKQSLRSLSGSQADSVRFITQDFTSRRSFNFTNVRKIKTDPNAKNHIWDIENWSATYAFNQYRHHDYINELGLQKTYMAALAYNFTTTPKVYTPFANKIKSNTLALFRDFNFSLLPSVLNFRIDVNRLYSENTLRDNNDPNNTIPITTTYNKNFVMSRLYGISWNLTKSLQLDFNATNYSVIDEPAGRVNGLVRDTIWQNLKKLGRTTNYNHTINFNYNVPLNKIPGLDWMTLVARYGANFNWNSEPLLTLKDPNIDYGNTIQNARTIQLNPNLNLNALYNKFNFVRKLNDPNQKPGFAGVMVGLLTSLKNISGAYTKTQGTFLPGYLPQTNILGYDFDANAPGWGFLFGSQADLRNRAVSNGWITTDTLQNQFYITTYKEDINFRGTLEPIRDLRIELTALRTRTFNYSTNFRFDNVTNEFQNLSPVTTGDFSISYFSLRTAFSKINPDGSSNLFKQFENNRALISRRLGETNPNSNGVNNGYADGYGANSQDVVTEAFMAAYTGKDANTINMNRFPKVPIPNWRLTYNGLTRNDFFNRLFASIDITHGYRSTYSVSSFNTLIRYEETNGAVSSRDVNNNFLPYYQFAQVTLFEQFVPLFGVDVRMKNNLTANFEYRKSRAMSLSLSNSQLAQQNETNIVFGMGYRTNNFRFPFGLFGGTKLKNDLNFKLDFSLNDLKTLIYRADVDDAEVSSGAKNISYRPSIDYVINQRFNIRLYYDGTITRPYTSQTFNTSFSNFGVSMRFVLQ